jgi:hypothetical protein
MSFFHSWEREKGTAQSKWTNPFLAAGFSSAPRPMHFSRQVRCGAGDIADIYKGTGYIYNVQVSRDNTMAFRPGMKRFKPSTSSTYWCVKHVGLLDGLLGVAGMMMKLIISQWIIPGNSLLSISKYIMVIITQY